MLDRVLEPELMDTPEEALAYDVMDHREVNRIFVDDLLEALGPQIQDASSMLKILDLGTGTALIPIELCRSTNHISVVAVDAADHMLQLARRNIEAAGLNDRITLLLADAKQSLRRWKSIRLCHVEQHHSSSCPNRFLASTKRYERPKQAETFLPRPNAARE